MITVYSKNNCPFCDRATALLESKGIEFRTVKMEDDPNARLAGKDEEFFNTLKG